MYGAEIFGKMYDVVSIVFKRVFVPIISHKITRYKFMNEIKTHILVIISLLI